MISEITLNPLRVAFSFELALTVQFNIMIWILQMMVNDLYGNCLVQTALEVSNTEQFTNMLARINHYRNIAKRFTYEPRIISMIEKLFKEGGELS
jgi:hypothetical protein